LFNGKYVLLKLAIHPSMASQFICIVVFTIHVSNSFTGVGNMTKPMIEVIHSI